MKQTGVSKNAKRGPALPQDPFRAYRRGFDDGLSKGLNEVLNIVVYTLVDNGFLNDEEIQQFANRFLSTVSMIEKGNAKLSDIKRVLKKEYDWEVNLR